MFERFTKDARAVVERAVGEAERSGSAMVEAEHLLLALADPDTPRGRGVGRGGRRGDGAFDQAAARHVAAVLAEAGLDAAALRDAFAAEEVASLDAVGIHAGDFGVLEVRPRRGRTRFAASAKQALERGVRLAVARGEQRLTSRHLALGVLAAERGRIPRTIELAGVDRDALRASLA